MHGEYTLDAGESLALVWLCVVEAVHEDLS